MKKSIEKILSKLHAKRVFLVTGEKSFQLSGAQRIINEMKSHYDFFRFSQFEKNPNISDLKTGIQKYKEFRPDMTMAIGGGSVLDMAKLINILANQDAQPESYIKKEKGIQRRGKPVMAIPTTSGSGSEATHFAAIYINEKKYSLAHEFLLPDFSLLNHELTYRLPKHLTASTGIDALSQAIESYWNVNSTSESKEYARKSIKLILDNLKESVHCPNNKNRKNMMVAANLAGKAINITKTTAPHAISYILTSKWGLPHGHAVGLTLGEFLVFNSKVSKRDCADPRGPLYIKTTLQEINKMFHSPTPELTRDKIHQLMRNIHLDYKLGSLGITSKEDKELIIDSVNYERLKNNPRKLNQEQLRRIINRIG